MSADADEPLHRHSNSWVDGDGEEDLGDGEQDGDEVGEGEEGVVGGDDWEREHEGGEEDAGGVRQQQKRQHVTEYWLQLKIFLLKNDQC